MVNADGTENTGIACGTNALASSGLFYVGNDGFGELLDGYFAEGGVWATTAFTLTQRNNMCHNQRLYWGSTGSC